MTSPDIQYFPASGTWVKPERAVAVDVMAMSGGSGWSLSADGRVTDGEDLPAELEVEIGRGGRPGGRDGYALIVTHLDAGSKDGQP